MKSENIENPVADILLAKIGRWLERGDYESLEGAKSIAWDLTKEASCSEEQQAEAIHYIARAHHARAIEGSSPPGIEIPFPEYLTTWKEQSHGDRLVTRPDTTTTFADLLERYYGDYMQEPRVRLEKGKTWVFEAP